MSRLNLRNFEYRSANDFTERARAADFGDDFSRTIREKLPPRLPGAR